MAALCVCPGGEHDGRFPYRSGTSGGPIVIERGGAKTIYCQPIPPGLVTVSCEAVPMAVTPDPHARIAELEAEVARLEALIVAWDDDEDRYGDPARALRCEASCIRCRKP